MSLTWIFADPTVAHNKRVRRRRRAHRRAVRAHKRHERSMDRRTARPDKWRRRWILLANLARFTWYGIVSLVVLIVGLIVLSYSGIRTLISRVTSERSHR